jgi:hypothetical protein
LALSIIFDMGGTPIKKIGRRSQLSQELRTAAISILPEFRSG